ncbi:MAG: PQQ-dependent sugar dehydrogenase [Acidimicrobiales bacterium]
MRARLHVRARTGVLIGAAVVIGACSSGGGGTAVTTTSTTQAVAGSTTTTQPLAKGTLDSVELTTTVVAKLDTPVAMAARPSTPDLYIAEQGGRVRLVKVTKPTSGSGPLRYQLQTTPVLDLTKDVLAGGERGLLGLAFSSDGRKLYVDYTAEPDGNTRVVEYLLGDRTTVDASSRRELLAVDQPAPNHNGGNLVIGPDGYLYVGLGDGGGSGDPDGHAQNRKDLLGSILRIDPEGGSDEREYGIPAGNPYADGKQGRPEIWLYGVRNPWRFSFDTATGDLWVGDVGQNAWEEIDRLPSTGGFDAGRGANLGWDRMEGTHTFEGDNPPGAVLPIAEYSHDDGCSVIGGYVYRGEVIKALRGVYLFADNCKAGVRGLELDRGTVIDKHTWPLDAEHVTSFGHDNDGELFVLLGSGSVLKLTTPSAATTTTRSTRTTTQRATSTTRASTTTAP